MPEGHTIHRIARDHSPILTGLPVAVSSPQGRFEADAAQRYPATIPWAWPKLLRITISLVDPTDPLREQTFQFIIEVPEAKGDRF